MTEYQIQTIKQMLHGMIGRAEANQECSKEWERMYQEKGEDAVATAYRMQANANQKHIKDLERISKYIDEVTNKDNY